MFSNIKILKEFSLYLILQKNCSKSTAASYEIDLKIFFNYLITTLNLNIKVGDMNVFLLSMVTEDIIYHYFIYLTDYRHLSANTRNRILSSIKSFYKWLYKEYYEILKCNPNPVANIKNINSIVRLPKYLELKDALKIQSIFNENNSKYFIRNNTIMVIFLNCGLRVSELSNINISDINFEKRTLRIIGKGNKERIISLSDKAIISLKEYLKIRNSTEKALFLSKSNKRLNRSGIESICKKAYKLCGLSDMNYTVHTLRHTFATYMYESTNDLLVVKTSLGHTSIAATQIYTHVSNQALKKAVDSNPLNNFKVKKVL